MATCRVNGQQAHRASAFDQLPDAQIGRGAPVGPRAWGRAASLCAAPLAGPRMGCGASAASVQRADAAGAGYAATEPRESAASRPAAPLVVDVESARALAPGAAAAAGPPSLNTLEAKHSSLADNWEKQRRESQKVQRQSSRDAG